MEVGKKFILETNKNGTLYFSDNLGRTVWQTQAEKGKQEITVPYLQAGVYVVTFASGSAKFKSRIIVR
jgi:hypothetical protein